MSTTLRFNALKDLMSRKNKEVHFSDNVLISDYYGDSVFNQNAMKEFLSDEAYKKVMEAVQLGSQLDRGFSDQIASAMKAWAISKGATHFTHWFQPLTGATAEKHDAFFAPTEGGGSIERFEGGELAQQEPDASSFPNGGIRNTFEARGYTAWDPSSPAFVFGKTLCIPTIFVSYTGEALDYKTPLLKALFAVDKAATQVCQYFDKDVTKVTATLGWEQEYFLMDKALFNARPDLVMSGRTLLGHSPAKGQQLDDHYFGSIPERASNYMKDLEQEAHKLGIPIRTRHNEVAPSQFECAPIFEEANLAVDHNQLLMDVMEKVARRHDYRILFHEKPFAGINGSGKHNNWSLATNTKVNLLSPGKKPKENLRFLTFIVNTIKAVHDNADLMRAAIASAGNDHRLGANEAPPAIISIFIGSQLTAMLEELEAKLGAGKMTPELKTELKLNIGKIPQIMLDNTDRNRTSPFAFTGNKFEFRAVGSSANCAFAMIVINTIMAKQLQIFKKEVDELIDGGQSKDEAIFYKLREYYMDSKKILFEGNGYSQEWVDEAEKRGLSNIRSTPKALSALASEKAMKLFTEQGVFTDVELNARKEIYLEQYTMKVQIEARVLGDVALNYVIPAAIRYQNTLIKNIRGLKEISGDGGDALYSAQVETVKEISEHITIMRQDTVAMVEERKNANNMENESEKAIAYNEKVMPYFESIRYHADKLEQVVDDEFWPLPKYREMLFMN